MGVIDKATKQDHGNTIEDLKSYEDKYYEVNGIPSPLHFYYLTDDFLNGEDVISGARIPRKRSLAPLMQSTGILSVMYVPFMDEQYLSLYKYNYDQEYFGDASNDPNNPAGRISGVFVYKIMGTQGGAPGPAPTAFIDYELDQIDKYPGEMRPSVGGAKSWANESKLFQYPYHYVTVNDYMNSPLQVRMDLIDGTGRDADRFKTSKQFQIKVRQSISINGSYTIYVPYLKGDKTGALEGMKSLSPMDLPTSSSQYAQFMANNKASYSVQNAMAIGNALLGNNGRIGSANTTIGQGMADIKNHKYWDESDRSGWGGAPAYKTDKKMLSSGKLKVKSGIFDIANELGSRVVNTAGTVASIHAKKSDLMSAPRNVSLQGGDVMDAITNSNRSVNAIRYHIQERYLQKLGDFFAMYGYKQNKVMSINLRSRKDYNYIKTVGANIVSKGAMGIPKKHINSLKAIFDKGITLWHVDRNDNRFMDYNRDNVEV